MNDVMKEIGQFAYQIWGRRFRFKMEIQLRWTRGGWRSTYHQVADNNLYNLGPETNATLEKLLKEPDEKVTQRSADQSAICGHLGDARSEVVAMLVAVLG
jgi:hypothetical protein